MWIISDSSDCHWEWAHVYSSALGESGPEYLKIDDAVIQSGCAPRYYQTTSIVGGRQGTRVFFFESISVRLEVPE